MKCFWSHWIRDDSGQDLVEYALLVLLIALGSVTALQSLAAVLNNVPNALMQKFWTAYTS